MYPDRRVLELESARHVLIRVGLIVVDGGLRRELWDRLEVRAENFLVELGLRRRERGLR